MAFNKGISLNPREERNNAGIVDVIFYFLDLNSINRIRKSCEFVFLSGKLSCFGFIMGFSYLVFYCTY